MKKLFLWMLFYYWVIAVGIQMVLYLFTGDFIHWYGNDAFLCPDQYYLKAALLITVIVGISMFLIWMFPRGKGELDSVILKDFGWYYYLLVLILIMVRLFFLGGANSDSFKTVLSGTYNGTLFAYMNFFTDLQTVFLILMLCTKQKLNLWTSCGLYVLYTMLCMSRSGALFVIIILMCILVASEKGKEYGNTIKRIIIVTGILAPVSYVLVTIRRGHDWGGSLFGIIEKIANRCSRLELAGIPLYELDKGIYNKRIFTEKYSLLHQVQLSVNSLLPGDIFPGDVQPNQYYRTAFLGVSERMSRENYTSINMTFPSYLTLKYGMVAAIIISVLVIIGLYCISLTLSKYVISRVVPVMLMIDILDFFDWVYIFQRILAIFCTIGLFWFVRKIFSKVHFKLPMGYSGH